MNALDPRRCVVLVPVGGPIVPDCEQALQELERRGYQVRRVPGYAAIDVARNEIASGALSDGFEETMWIDSDIVFHPDAVEQLRAHQLPICCGIYPKKGQRKLAVHVLPGTEQIVFGRDGGLVEIQYAATGFLHVRREVYETMQSQLQLPVCNRRFGTPVSPYFMPMIVDEADDPWYLGEDYAFCERARRCGYQVLADTRIRLLHFGQYGFSWEDAGGSFERFASYNYRLT